MESPKGIYEAFYRDGLKEGVAFGRCQIEALQEVLSCRKEEAQYASEEMWKQQIVSAELRDEIRSLQKQLADLRQTKVRIPDVEGPATTIGTKQDTSTSTAPCGLDSVDPISRLHTPTRTSNLTIPRAGEVPPVTPTGTTTPSEASVEGYRKENPRLEDAVEDWYDYFCNYRNSWPRGVRRDACNRPVLSDLRADRAVARFRPWVDVRGREEAGRVRRGGRGPDGRSSASPRAQFKIMLVELFSQKGLYTKLIVQQGLYVAGTATYGAYQGPFPVTTDGLVAFLAKSGVTPQLAASDFEPWARNYRDGVNESIRCTSSSTRRDWRRR